MVGGWGGGGSVGRAVYRQLGSKGWYTGGGCQEYNLEHGSRLLLTLLRHSLN